MAKSKKSEGPAGVPELFQAPAQIMKLETMSDGGIRVVLDTGEMTDPAELAKLFRLKKGSIGWFLFKETAIKGEDVPTYDPKGFEEEKSPSERLRGVLFVYWKEVKKGEGDFDSFYRSIINTLVDRYKEKLPPRGDDGWGAFGSGVSKT